MIAWLRPHLLYAQYVFRHKLYVYRAGRALGLWPWQLLLHDLSKFRPDEWVPYADYFYGGPRRPWSSVPTWEKEHAFDRAYANSQDGVSAAFDRAWLLHQHRNPHHYQFWVLREDDGSTKVLPMPDRYLREMLADWRGAGLALGKPDTRAWYVVNRDNIVLHADTRAWVERELAITLTMVA